jgi:phosphate transport system protein
MSLVLQKEIERIKKHILAMGASVEQQLYMAMKSLTERDGALTQKVIEGDVEINKVEVDLEEECLKLLALHQPVAIDLRYIISIIKINRALERIGDLAVNIAERVAFLVEQPNVKTRFNLPDMAEIVKTMLKKSLDALVNMNEVLACEVIDLEDEVDDMNRKMYNLAIEDLRSHISDPASIIQITSISRHLERIADQSTNIAEDVIYMIEGKIIRHKKESYRPSVK